MQRRTPKANNRPESSHSYGGEGDKVHAVDAEVKKKGLTRVLDWKLDFINLEWREKYYKWNMQTMLYLARVNISLVVIAYFLVLVFSGFYYRNFYNTGPDKDFNAPIFINYLKLIISTFGYGGAALVLLFVPYVKNHAAYVGPFCFTGLILMYLFQKVVAKTHSTLVDPDAYGPSIFMLSVFVTMRAPVKASVPFMAIPVISHIVVTLIDNVNSPWYYIFGVIVIMVVVYCVGIFCGSEIEKRAKFDYLVKYLMDAEAEKLSWAVARDLALLRNIFPKNLSDELEKQMTSDEKRKRFIPIDMERDSSSSSLGTEKSGVTKMIRSLSHKISHTGFRPIAVEPSPAPLRAQTPQAWAPNAAPATLPPTTPTAAAPTHPFGIEMTPIAAKGGPEVPSAPLGSSWKNLSITLPETVAAGVTSGVLSPESRAASGLSTPVYHIPPVVNPFSGVHGGLPDRHLTSSGMPLNSQHHPEIYTFFNGAQHEDGSLISLSHSYPSVTVVMADIVGFTALSSTISPEELVGLLNYIFSKFDDIMEELQLEKIRTLGDAYLCVANMSIPLENHESAAVEAASRMLRLVQSITGKNLNLRVGIASGALLAGVTGLTKWNYDIFGGVVEEATMMETSSPPGGISVTKSVYQGAKTNLNFEFEYFPAQSIDGVERYQLRVNKRDIALVSDVANETPMKEEKYLELNLNNPNKPEITLEDLKIDTDRPERASEHSSFNHMDPSNFDYSKDEIEDAIKALEKAWVWFRFSNPTFEKEYHKNITHKTYSFTVKYIYLLLFTTVAYLFIDMLIDVGDIHTPAFIITRLIQFAVVLGYLWFIRNHNDWKYEEYVGMFVIWIYGFATCINAHYYVLAGSFMTTFFIEKSFRREFLNRKVIFFNVFHQKQAQARSNLLLYNILPQEIVPRLLQKTDNPTTVDKFEDATMMFVNLTNMDDVTAGLNDGDVFKVYNEIFTLFDQSTRDHGLEKIKTINTVYMVAAGLPRKTDTHAEDAILLAKSLHKIAQAFHVNGIPKPIKLRVGVASGPIVAGIIGKKKYAYDCWSDTTNTASRMESNGWVGHVQVSPNVYRKVQDKFIFQRRDGIYIKGKGQMNLYIMQL